MDEFGSGLTFKERVRGEMALQGLIAKELAAKAGISVHTLNMYIGSRESIPAADIAVKIAKALNRSVEFLINGSTKFGETDADIYGYLGLDDPIEYFSEEEDLVSPAPRDRSVLYLKGKGQKIEVRHDSKKSNAFIKKIEERCRCSNRRVLIFPVRNSIVCLTFCLRDKWNYFMELPVYISREYSGRKSNPSIPAGGILHTSFFFHKCSILLRRCYPK